MFPIRDHNPTGRTPVVTWALIAANVLVFLTLLPRFGDERALAQVFYAFGTVPVFVSHGEALGGLFTSMFLHASFLHLAGNMLFLWIFGDNLEEALGHVGFGLFYLAAGLGAALFQVATAPASQVPMVGASGAIAGVMGGYLLLYPRARVDVLFILVIIIRIIPLPAWLVLAVWFALQVVSGVSAPAEAAGVAYWAHTGGFLVGLVWVIPAWLRRGGAAYWRQTHGRPQHPDTAYRLNRSRVPVVRRRRR